MKKTTKIVSIMLIIAIMLITLTGCANSNYNVTINNDGSADVEYLMEYNKEDINKLSGMGVTSQSISESLTAEVTALNKNGYTAEKLDTDTTVGYKFTKHYDNATDVVIGEKVAESYMPEENTNSITVEKGFFTTKYKLNTTIDLTTLSFTDSETTIYTGKTVDELISIKFIVNTPGRFCSSNATSKSNFGKTLEWKLETGRVNEITMESTKLNTVTVLLILLILIAIIILVVLIADKKIKIKNTDKTKKTASKIKTAESNKEKLSTKKANKVADKKVEKTGAKAESTIKEDSKTKKIEDIKEKTNNEKKDTKVSELKEKEKDKKNSKTTDKSIKESEEKTATKNLEAKDKKEDKK